MEKTRLTKREYLGEGYFHQFRNLETGEIKYSETTKEQYESMQGVDGWKNNPVPEEGWESTFSQGGAIKTENGILREGEFVVLDGFYHARFINGKGELDGGRYTEEEFNKYFTWQ